MALAGYLAACWIAACGVLPVVTLLHFASRQLCLAIIHAPWMWQPVWVTGRLAGPRDVSWLSPRVMRFSRSICPNESCRCHGCRHLGRTDDPASERFAPRGTPDKVFFYHVMDLCNAWQPDLVALTGDVVDSGWHHRWIVPVLGRLRGEMRPLPSLAITIRGTIFADSPKAWRAGMHVLGNAWEQIEVRGQPLILISHEGPGLARGRI